MQRLSRSHSRGRLASLWALLTAGTLLLASCSSITGGASQSGSKGGLFGGPKKPDLKIEDASYPSEGVSVDGLHGQRIVSSLGIAARWDDLPGQWDFNKTVTTAVSKQVKAYAKSVGEKYKPEAHATDSGMAERGCVSGSTFLDAEQILQDPELSAVGDGEGLAVVCEPVLAAGTTFGQRIRYVEGSSTEVSSDTVQTFYTDTQTGEVAREQNLLNADSMEEFYRQAAPLFAKRVDLDGDLMMPASEGAELLHSSVSAIQFEKDGGATVTVDKGFLNRQLEAVDRAMDLEENPSVDIYELPAPSSFSIFVDSELIPDFFTPLGESIASAQEQGLEWAGTETYLPGKTYTNCTLTPCVALTFDDGPSEYTPQLLQDLADKGAAATFYLVGGNAEYFPEIVKQIDESGNELGNHSLTHPPLTTLSSDGVSHELTTTDKFIFDASGVTPATVRPPYGDWNESVLATAGVPFIMWSMDTNDWQKPGHDALVNMVVHDSVPGDIILMHDIHPETTAAVPDMLTGLNDRGFTMATIHQLLGKKRLAEPDVIYSK